MTESYTNSYIRGIKEDSTAENMIEAFENGTQSIKWLAGSLQFWSGEGEADQCQRLCRVIEKYVKSERTREALIAELVRRVKCPCLDSS